MKKLNFFFIFMYIFIVVIVVVLYFLVLFVDWSVNIFVVLDYIFNGVS